MNNYFSKFQLTIFSFVILGLFIFFLLFNIFKLTEIFKSVYIQENQSVESYNSISLTFFSTLEKSIKSFFPKKILNLPEIRIYVKENEYKSLFDNLPNSKNQWIKSYVMNSTKKKLVKSKIKIRGDNPNNWLHSKKSFRIQLGKKNLSNFNRTLDYVIPRDTSLVNTYMGYFIADMMNIISPDVRYVNLYINDKSQGLFLEVERTSENFLRKRNIMPVNVYNGSPSRTNTPLSINNDLFVNANLWKKQSVFNRLDENDKSDMYHFLNLLINSINSDTYFSKLTQISRIDEWAKYSAYETLMQSWHSYENNNMKVIFDNWKGEIIPISYDAILNDARNELVVDQEIIYDNAPHLLHDTFLKSSEFNLKKFLIIKEFIDNDKYELVKNEIDRVYNDIRKSWHADSNHYQFVVTNNFRKDLFFNSNMDDEIEKLKKRVDFIEEGLKKIIYEESDLEWTYEKNIINLIFSTIPPISSINLCYKNFLNLNQYTFYDDSFESYKYNKQKNLNCYQKDITLISERLPNNLNLSKPTHFRASNGFKTVSTGFKLKSNFDIKPDLILYKTYSNKDFQIANFSENHTTSYITPNILNKKIYNNHHEEENFIVYQGKNFITEDLIISEPVFVKPGTEFILDNKTSIIFKNKVIMSGNKDKKITFRGKTNETKWGTISIEGNESNLNHINFIGGFGDIINNKFYTSMLSVRNVKNVILKNINFFQSKHEDIPNFYDDLMHIIYSKNINLINLKFYDSLGDALDVDVSSVDIDNCYFENSGNDSIDFMSSVANILNTKIYKSGDKGVSVGENSKIVIKNIFINNAFIGLESKDGSIVEMRDSILSDNIINLHGYNKNWRYGKFGGDFNIINTKFVSNKLKEVLVSKIKNAEGEQVHKNLNDFKTNKNVFISKNKSKINIENTNIESNYVYFGNKKDFNIIN